ncbi:CFI-box-CTERM domain-containing protein [Bdellovibrio sp. HCB185ZH]|uniref:CFI-box-CTERM domain-containing protein n=1 Tax=Bdellovibrio sp. HCB185ZH TaxID=3394235 RepID=UPI0039A42282
MRLLKLSALFATSLFVSSVAMAASFTSVTIGGASYYDLTTTPSKPVIYGGFAGTCTGDGNSTCNSCTGSGLTPCNQNAAYPNLILTLTLTADVSLPTNGTVTVKIDDNSVSLNTAPYISGSTLTVKMLWSQICLKSANGVQDCSNNVDSDLVVTITGSGTTTTTVSATLHVITSATTTQYYTDCPVGTTATANTGFCNFTAFPGDSKMYTDPIVSDGYPVSSTGIDFRDLVFFYEEQIPADGNNPATTVGRITNASPTSIMPVSSTTFPPDVDDRLTGLTNGKTYCAVMANRDLAGNIYYFTPTTVDPTTLCATPEPVVGLLDDKHCFIATAAFGSDMAPEVQSFREFRNKYLIPYSWGQKFVKTYYKYSPKYAAMISQSETAKIAVRGVLWPLLFFARLSVALGFWFALAITVFGGLTIWGLYRRLILGQNVRGEL